MEIIYSSEKRRCLGWVVAIHMILAILLNKFLKENTSVAMTFLITLPLMYRVYWGKFEPNARKRILKQKFKERIRKNFRTRAGREKLYLDIAYGIMISFILFIIMLVGQHYFEYQLCPSHTINPNIFYFYLLLSVPGQQLLFFIWPQILLEGIVSRRISFVSSVLLFGNLHNYYPELITPVLAAIILGIPSAILVYYFKNPFAAIMCHAIIGSAGLLLGFV